MPDDKKGKRTGRRIGVDTYGQYAAPARAPLVQKSYKLQELKNLLLALPPAFGLKDFPGDTFRVSKDMTFYHDDDTITIGIQRKTASGWQDFALAPRGQATSDHLTHGYVRAPKFRAGEAKILSFLQDIVEAPGDKPAPTSDRGRFGYLGRK